MSFIVRVDALKETLGLPTALVGASQIIGAANHAMGLKPEPSASLPGQLAALESAIGISGPPAEPGAWASPPAEHAGALAPALASECSSSAAPQQEPQPAQAAEERRAPEMNQPNYDPTSGTDAEPEGEQPEETEAPREVGLFLPPEYQPQVVLKTPRGYQNMMKLDHETGQITFAFFLNERFALEDFRRWTTRESLLQIAADHGFPTDDATLRRIVDGLSSATELSGTSADVEAIVALEPAGRARRERRWYDDDESDDEGARAAELVARSRAVRRVRVGHHHRPRQLPPLTPARALASTSSGEVVYSRRTSYDVQESTRLMAQLCAYVQVHGGSASLLDGWWATRCLRRAGHTAGRSDPYYHSPAQGHAQGLRFRSKCEVVRFLGLISEGGGTRVPERGRELEARACPPLRVALRTATSVAVDDAPAWPTVAVSDSDPDSEADSSSSRKSGVDVVDSIVIRSSDMPP
jgi:hypothetical protein